MMGAQLANATYYECWMQGLNVVGDDFAVRSSVAYDAVIVSCTKER